MENTYMDRLPDELLMETFLYLDVDYIQKESNKFAHNIIESKIFWMKKFKHDGLEEYVQYLGLFHKINNYTNLSNYIEDYIKIKN